jgi:hypothetical protein
MVRKRELVGRISWADSSRSKSFNLAVLGIAERSRMVPLLNDIGTPRLAFGELFKQSQILLEDLYF